jgi:hypothetical protein
LLKLFYLALNNIAKKWTMPVQNWKPVLNHLPSHLGKESLRIHIRPVTQNSGHFLPDSHSALYAEWL